MNILKCDCDQFHHPETQSACDHCLFLDGKTKPQIHVIATLREAGGVLSLKDITVRMGVTKRHVQRTLRGLIKMKRVVRRQVDAASPAMFSLRS